MNDRPPRWRHLSTLEERQAYYRSLLRAKAHCYLRGYRRHGDVWWREQKQKLVEIVGEEVVGELAAEMERLREERKANE